MASDRIRIGVIGLAFGSQVHIPAFQSEGMEVVAVCSRNEQRVQEVAAQFDIPLIFTDFEKLVSMDDLDAVSIASPVAMHFPMTMAALNAGKHVLCEKPFCIDQNQAKQLWQKAEEVGVTAMIAHEFRFASARMRVNWGRCIWPLCVL